MSTGGHFALTTPRDLLGKLGRDLKALREAPGSPDAAFNFFVTAEHMVDWLFPGYDRRPEREARRNSETLLQVVSHIANGAKHFVVEAPHHKSVRATEQPPSSFGAGTFGAGPFGMNEMFVVLEGEAASRLGERLRAADLAQQVFAYWEAAPELV